MLLKQIMTSNLKNNENKTEEEGDGMVAAKLMYKAVEYLFRDHCHLLLVAAILLFFCSPSLGYFPDFGQAEKPILSPAYLQQIRSGYQVISRNNKRRTPRNSRSRSSRGNDRWRQMSPEERESLQKKYREWQSLPPKEQQMMRRRMDEFNRMSPQKREAYEQMFRQWQNLSPGERKQLQRDLDNWERLSPQEKDAIRRRFRR